MPLMLMSPAFPQGGAIPAEYTCDGTDISPPLKWSGAPPGTKSFVLVVEDPDAPSGVFRHWAAFDIPAGWSGLDQGFGRARPGSGFHEARNDFGSKGYGGPCPPSGTHHYHFKLFAVSRPTLGVGPSPTVEGVLRAVEPYAIARSELVGSYRR